MPDREKELLNYFRQLPPEDQAAVLSRVRSARGAENSAKKAPAKASAEDGGSGKGLMGGKVPPG
ncbi:hypothetical protein AGMMS49944_10900 [Spirochaetia bacterium]|nr:hypothetical protein AGMMS49944_10900 [Spirochaetia bacterium]